MDNIVLKNAADENVTFVPQQQSAENVVFMNKTATQQALFKSLSVTQLLSKGSRPNNRVIFEIKDPHLKTDFVTDVKSLPFSLARVEFVFPGAMTTTDRADALAYVSSLLDTTVAQSVIKELNFLV